LKILITGAAGFIGFHSSLNLLEQNDCEVIGLDNINDYYPMTLKFERLKQLGISPDYIRYNSIVSSEKFSNFSFVRLDITDETHIFQLFERYKFDYVIHLAAQAGVRFSIDNPNSYIQSNVVGFSNILEACKAYPVKHLVYASSSSVYGLNNDQPFSPEHKTDKPISLYAATKKSNELMAYTYSHLFRIPTSGLRFFTVYGPWGRPDMAPMLFAKAIIENKSIKVFNNGKLERDFTYISDIVEALMKITFALPKSDLNGNQARIINIGNGNPVHLLDFISALEESLGKEAKKDFLPMQDGDVYSTYADISDLVKETGYKPKVGIKEGVSNFVEWFTNFYKI